jgi:predicted DCC family thiol-disulfide oxidoreductase YuxK
MGLAKILPKAVRNIAYNLVAKNRYRVFGKHDSCMLPDPENKDKFLEV